MADDVTTDDTAQTTEESVQSAEAEAGETDEAGETTVEKTETTEETTETTEETTEKTKKPISESKKELGSEIKLEIKVQALVEKMFRAKDNAKDIKNTLKAYKVTSEKLEELKKARKEFSQQVTEEKDRIEAEFQKDNTYNELREKLLDCEEKIAVAKQDLRTALREKAMKNEFVEMQFEIDGIPFKLQTQAKVALYFNGKEEK